MASGYIVSGRGDLDSLFLARSSAKAGNVGYQVGGVDISNRYEPIGAGTPIAATGYKYANTDLANIFRGSGQPLSNYSMTAAAYATTTIGFISTVAGALSPTTFGGVTIWSIADDTQVNNFAVSMQANVGQSFFSSISINGKTYTSASATFSPWNGFSTVWTWPSPRAGLANGGVYPILLV